MVDDKAIQTKQQRNLVAIFSLLSKLSQADGKVSKSEVQVVNDLIKNVLQLDGEKKHFAVSVFNQARTSEKTFEEFAQEFAIINAGKKNVLEWAIDLLLSVAFADGYWKEEEKKLIKSAIKLFNIDEDTYRQLKAKYSASDDCDYSILGCMEDEPFDRVKEKYLKLRNEYDPKKLAAAGLPVEFLTLAEEKSKQLDEAYKRLLRAQNT